MTVQQQSGQQDPSTGAGRHGVPPRRVLVAFDDSPGAWAALEQAIRIAEDQRAILTIATVVSEPGFWCGSGLGPAPPVSLEGLRRELDADAQRRLAAARDEVPATVSVRTVMLRGRRASRALRRELATGGYDLVVTGPRPAGRFGHLRSVTRALLDRGTVSVLAVREPVA